MNTNSPTEFYDHFGAKLLSDFVSGNPRLEAAVSFACAFLKKQHPNRILDLGCGLGWSSYEYTRALPAAEVFGIDLSPRLAELAAGIFPTGRQLRYTAQDLTDPAWISKFNGTFDACVMLDFYEHIPRDFRSQLHAAFSKALSPKGTLLLSCPTKMHQDYLRNSQPRGLQPVDEDVTIHDLMVLASEIGGELVHYEQKSIWAENDYFHAAISRANARQPKTHVVSHQLISKSERLKLLEGSQIIKDRELAELRKMHRGRTRRLLARLVKGHQ